MEKLRLNLEKIQRGVQPSTRSQGVPPADTDVLRMLELGGGLVGPVTPVQAAWRAKKVGQQVYQFVPVLGEWSFCEFRGALTKEELKVAQVKCNKADELSAYWYSYHSTRGEKVSICWLSALSLNVAKKVPPVHFVKTTVYCDPAPGKTTKHTVNWLQCDGCKAWKSVDARAWSLFYRYRFQCVDVGTTHGEKDTDETTPRSHPESEQETIRPLPIQVPYTRATVFPVPTHK